MRIGIDGYNMAMPHGTGVASYGRALVDAVQAMGHQADGIFGLDVGADPALREILFFDRFAREAPRRPVRGLRWVRDAIGRRLGATALEVTITGKVEQDGFRDRMPRFDRLFSSADLFVRGHRHLSRTGRFLCLRMDDPPEIMHWTYPVPVQLEGVKNIYTLHDLVPLRLPHTTLDHKLNYHRMIATCLVEAAHICTDSEASRADILSMFDVAPEKVTNTWLAAPSAARPDDPMDDAATVEGIFGLPHRSYFLYFGAIEPRKNIARLVEAYLSLRTDTRLVLVGARSLGGEGELKLLNDGGYGPMADRIIRLSYLPRGLLLKLIRGARAVTFPSLYEGFGLPVLEAMQLGTPVLTSDRNAMPEVAGGAALLVNPYSLESIGAGLRTIDGDAALRERLAAAGLVRAAHFSPGRFQERLAGVYAGVTAQG